MNGQAVSRLSFKGNSFIDGHEPVQTSFPFRFANGVRNQSFIISSVGGIVVLVVVAWLVDFGVGSRIGSVIQTSVAFNIAISFVEFIVEIVDELAGEAVDAMDAVGVVDAVVTLDALNGILSALSSEIKLVFRLLLDLICVVELVLSLVQLSGGKHVC